MAKDRTEAEARERKEKKDKKRKRDESGAAGAEDGVVAKKEKKDKKRKSEVSIADVSMTETPLAVSKVKDVAEDNVEDSVTVAQMPLAALVPFALPLADEKAQKKVLKSVKRAAKNKALKRGVKECVKAIRKSSAGDPAALVSTSSLPTAIVILAGDISPMDVISHIPVLCEDHNIPYVFVPSRAELGAAGNTKRPTSIVLITPKPGKAKEAEVDAEWEDTYKDLHKLILKMDGPPRY